jgi:hypothetical protein
MDAYNQTNYVPLKEIGNSFNSINSNKNTAFTVNDEFLKQKEKISAISLRNIIMDNNLQPNSEGIYFKSLNRDYVIGRTQTGIVVQTVSDWIAGVRNGLYISLHLNETNPDAVKFDGNVECLHIISEFKAALAQKMITPLKVSDKKLALVANAETAVEHVEQKITDPIHHLISINCHGTFVNDTFKLPPNVYLLVPHPKGFEKPYILKSPPNGLSFEELIYNRTDGKVPSSSSGGWHVYKPGEHVRNLRLDPWSNSSNVMLEFSNWKERVPPEDVQEVKVSESGTIPPFAVVPARDSKNKKLIYHKEVKTKVKIFGNTNLQQIINELLKKNPNKPIVIAPFTCNAAQVNEEVYCHNTKTEEIKSLFDK